MAYSQYTEINANSLLNAIYPVGSIYMSVTDTSPASFLGGTWEQLQNRFLLGAGSKTAGTTGGEENHTLTIGEIPSHGHTASSGDAGTHEHATTGSGKHAHGSSALGVSGKYSIGHVYAWSESGPILSWDWDGGPSWQDANGKISIWEVKEHTHTATSNGNHSHSITVNANGGGATHNNMPPYLTVYMWKRTK